MTNHSETHPAEGLPYFKFILAISAQLAGIVAVFYFLLPDMFRQELAQPLGIVLWTLGFGIPLSLFEYLYHRYLLHSAVLPFMSSMHRAHSTHHGLTYVKAPVTPKEPEKLVPVESRYPVEEEHQEDSMMFPMWSYPIFMVVFMILLALSFKAMFPEQPVVFGVIAAVTLYYCGYEIWHAILHLPYDKFWKPMIEGRHTARLASGIYKFHLMHHWRPTSNLAVVGFWGFAIWDHAFRTHRRPERLPVDGAEVNFHDVKLEQPIWPISMLDRWQSKLYKGSRAVEAFFARVFLRRRSQP